MPPFAGTAEERVLVAGYLALLGGAAPESLTTAASAGAGASGKGYYEANCAACHTADAMAPFDAKGRVPSVLYDLIGRLPEINDMMPAFEGTEAERRALAEYLSSLSAGAEKGGGR
jgi:mono/diheme cytochrome c family protein